LLSILTLIKQAMDSEGVCYRKGYRDAVAILAAFAGAKWLVVKGYKFIFARSGTIQSAG